MAEYIFEIAFDETIPLDGKVAEYVVDKITAKMMNGGGWAARLEKVN